jgi:tRNA-2-methylthio-N6-dimethylallyladenosine synthase
VPAREKKRRLDAVNALQEAIAAEINARLLGQHVEILVEGRHKGKWKGRTRTNKLVFFADDSGVNWRGRLAEVVVTWTGPWSLQAEIQSKA